MPQIDAFLSASDTQALVENILQNGNRLLFDHRYANPEPIFIGDYPQFQHAVADEYNQSFWIINERWSELQLKWTYSNNPHGAFYSFAHRTGYTGINFFYGAYRVWDDGVRRLQSTHLGYNVEYWDYEITRSFPQPPTVVAEYERLRSLLVKGARQARTPKYKRRYYIAADARKQLSDGKIVLGHPFVDEPLQWI
jgi:hypothetical protein